MTSIYKADQNLTLNLPNEGQVFRDVGDNINSTLYQIKNGQLVNLAAPQYVSRADANVDGKVYKPGDIIPRGLNYADLINPGAVSGAYNGTISAGDVYNQTNGANAYSALPTFNMADYYTGMNILKNNNAPYADYNVPVDPSIVGYQNPNAVNPANGGFMPPPGAQPSNNAPADAMYPAQLANQGTPATPTNLGTPGASTLPPTPTNTTGTPSPYQQPTTQPTASTGTTQPTTQPAGGTPSPYQSAPYPTTPIPQIPTSGTSNQILQQVLDLMKPSSAETDLQNKIIQMEAQRQALITGQTQTNLDLSNQPIAMPFVSGQQAAVDKQYQITGQTQALQEQTVQQQLALEQAKRQSSLDASKYALDSTNSQSNTAFNQQIAAAQLAMQQQAAQYDANKPVTVGYGGALIDPRTGQTIGQGQAHMTSVGANSTLYDAYGDIIGTGTNVNPSGTNLGTGFTGGGATTPTPGSTNTGTGFGTQPSGSSFSGFPTSALQPGSTGAGVQQLQDFLVSQGLMTQAQKQTGYGTYGPQTTAAVQALQQKLGVNNASGPGYFGPQTIQALQSGATGGAPTGGTSSGSTSTLGTPATGNKALATLGGGQSYTQSDLNADAAQLASARGTDGWTDPAKYLALYQAWTSHQGSPADFLKLFPPKQWINPANTNPQIVALGGGVQPKKTTASSSSTIVNPF